jgi:hypothetical protein
MITCNCLKFVGTPLVICLVNLWAAAENVKLRILQQIVTFTRLFIQRIYGKTCLRRNMDRTESCLYWKTFAVPRMLHLTSCTCNKRAGIVWLATGYGLDYPGIEPRWRRDFPHPSSSALGHTSPLDNGYRVSFLGGKLAGT